MLVAVRVCLCLSLCASVCVCVCVCVAHHLDPGGASCGWTDLQSNAPRSAFLMRC